MEVLAELVWLVLLGRFRLLAGSSPVRVAIRAVGLPAIAYCIGLALGAAVRLCGS